MNKPIRKHRLGVVFVLVIFCVFAASVLGVLILGGSVYTNTVAISRTGYDERVALSFIWTQVKSADVAGNITIVEYTDFWNPDSEPIVMLALAIEEFDENRGEYIAFENRIFYMNGWLHEVTSFAGSFIGVGFTQPIIPTTPILFESIPVGDASLIRVTAGTRTMFIHPR